MVFLSTSGTNFILVLLDITCAASLNAQPLLLYFQYSVISVPNPSFTHHHRRKSPVPLRPKSLLRSQKHLLPRQSSASRPTYILNLTFTLTITVPPTQAQSKVRTVSPTRRPYL